ncbi:beta-propeller of ELYS nucleoporin [Popillia japonica]|uniref:Beta-propeller of ELYS nucleoporin n=1 Tax=Popillia japonica TaxID=7064 RepID=A0AAW1IBL7_POPJA
MSKLLTPIIKRKSHTRADLSKIGNEKVDICTPQSILKVRNLVISQSPTTTTHLPIVTSKSISTPSNTTVGVLGLTPRRSLSRSGVRFEKINESYCTDSSEMIQTFDATNLSNQNSKSLEMKSSPSIEAFYSPNTSENNNENDQSVTSSRKNIEPSLISVEYSQVITDTVAKITESEQEFKRVSLKSRGTYRDSHSRFQNVETKAQEDSDKLNEVEIDKKEITSRGPIRSSRAKSQEPEVQAPVSLSPRRSSLRISQRKSVSKLVLEDTSLAPLYLENSTQIADGSTISSLASEDFDHMIKNQLFSIPHISLSPTQCSTCIDTDESIDKEKLEESSLKSVNMVDAGEKVLTQNQSRRNSFKVTGRKSLSRMVLERNLGTMFTSTPHHSFVEETKTESVNSSHNVSTHIAGTSGLSPTEQQELDRLISSSITHEERSAVANRENPNGTDMKPENVSRANKIDTDVLRPNLSSPRPSGRLSFRNQDTSRKKEADKLQIEDAKDVINPVTDDFQSQETSNKQVEVVHIAETLHKQVDLLIQNLQLQKDTGVAIDASLDEHLLKAESADNNQMKETHEVSRDNMPENIETNDYYISSSILPDRQNITLYETNELDNAQLIDTNVIEIPDSSSSSYEESVESDKSFRYSNIDEQEDEEYSASTINSTSTIKSDSEISSVESSNDVHDISEKFEEANDAFLQMQTHMELESQYVTEVLVGDSSNEMENMEVEFDNVAYTDVLEEILVSEPVEDAGNEEAQVALGEIESTSAQAGELGTDNRVVKEHINTFLEDEKEGESSLQVMVGEVQPGLDDNACENNDTSTYPHPHLDNVSTEASVAKEVSFESTYNDLTDNSTNRTDVDSKEEPAERSDVIQKVTKAKLDYANPVSQSEDLMEIKEHTSSKDDNQCATDLAQPTDHSHKMQLRTRRLSNTSIESPQKRTPRKRSASVDEIINREQTSTQSALLSTPKTLHVQKNKSKIQNTQDNPRTLRNRRAASVSDIPDDQIQTSSSNRNSKRTTSVSNLPIISEESTKIMEESSKENVTDKTSQADEFEEYSTSRRLTRNQKHLLERSKGKLSTSNPLNKVPKHITTSVEEVADNDNTQHGEASSTASESRARVRTRRMSQESTSSLVSTGNSASDAGSPPKRKRSSQKPQSNSSLLQTSTLRRGRSRSIDEVSVTSQISKSSRTTRQSDISDSGDQSTASLRRSTRNRSKTPDTDAGFKSSSRDKKVLGKIPEEPDDESKELLIKRNKPKKK